MADKKDWVANPTKYDLYTKVLKESLNGGVILESELTEDEKAHVDEGIELGLLDREEIITCADSTCTKTYAREYAPETCLCDARFPDENDETDITNRQPNTGHFTTRYEVSDPPHLYSTVIGDTLAGHPTEWDFVDFETAVKGYNLNRVSGSPTIHVSPFYVFDMPVVSPENSDDLFFCWEHLPEIALADDQDKAAEIAIENRTTLSTTQASRSTSARENLI